MQSGAGSSCPDFWGRMKVCEYGVGWPGYNRASTPFSRGNGQRDIVDAFKSRGLYQPQQAPVSRLEFYQIFAESILFFDSPEPWRERANVRFGGPNRPRCSRSTAGPGASGKATVSGPVSAKFYSSAGCKHRPAAATQLRFCRPVRAW